MQDEQFIGHYKQAPAFMKDNKDITHGYRIGFNTPKKIIKSLFMLHNEFINVWTHFFPAIIIFCVVLYLAITVEQDDMISRFDRGQQKLYFGIGNLSEDIGRFVSAFNISKIKERTGNELSQMEASLIARYSELSDLWRKNLELSVHNYGQSIRQSMQRMEELKLEFENHFVPHFLNQILNKINPEKLQQLRVKLVEIQERIDSRNYQYIEWRHQDDQNSTQVSRWPLLVMLLSAVICLMCSTIFHLFLPISGAICQILSRLDYAGINILIVGSSFPALYYGMYCNPGLAAFYLIFIVLIGTTLFVFTLFEYLHRPENLVLKSLAYGGFGISLAIPFFHALINEAVFSNYGDSFTMIPSVDEYVCCGIAYLFGLYVYTVRCPERHRPGNYNICGHSHQIWHCFVVVGIIFTYLGASQNLETRRHAVCAATGSALPVPSS